ncbi:MAG: aldo/keto reductase, partial [Saprospiraceae bacterium]
ILYWGTSEWSAQEIMEAHMVARERNLIAPVMEQSQYNMLTREKVEVEYAQLYSTVGLGNTIWSPLASGILSGKYADGLVKDTRLSMEGLEWLRDRNLTEANLEIVSRIAEFAKDLNISLANLAIAWCVSNMNVSTAIIGASKLVQLKENLKSIELLPKMNSEMLEKIDLVLNNKPVHPMY